VSPVGVIGFKIFDEVAINSYWLTFGLLQLIMNKKDVFPKRAAFEKDEAGSEVEQAGGDGFTDATFSSLSMILVSEVFISANVSV